MELRKWNIRASNVIEWPLVLNLCVVNWIYWPHSEPKRSFDLALCSSFYAFAIFFFFFFFLNRHFDVMLSEWTSLPQSLHLFRPVIQYHLWPITVDKQFESIKIMKNRNRTRIRVPSCRMYAHCTIYHVRAVRLILFWELHSVCATPASLTENSLQKCFVLFSIFYIRSSSCSFFFFNSHCK